MISVLILTKNEEIDIEGCIKSVEWSDDIHVYDSFSSDNTIDIAKDMGAFIRQRRFDGYASQRNAALRDIDFKYDWVLILDADERIPLSLYDEMRKFTEDKSSQISAARIRRRDFFFERQLKYVQTSPYYIRLIKPEFAKYEREINEVVKIDGEIKDLKEPFDHYPFSKGIAQWVEKHNRYSTMEAKELMKSRNNVVEFSLYKAFFERDFNRRRFHQKELFYRIPFRPFLKFIILYGFKMGFMDGKAGFTYAVLQSFYEYMIDLKFEELKKSLV